MRVFKLKTLKIIMLLSALIACSGLLTGCGAATIEGTWVLTEEIEANGNKLSKEQLEAMGISERYVIAGEDVKYTCNSPGAEKPIEIEFKLNDLGNNKYEFKVSDSFTFNTVEIKGSKMIYKVGSDNESNTMIFEKK